MATVQTMIPDRLLTTTAQLISRTQDGAEDAFGTPTVQETTTEIQCHIQPVSADEVEDRAAGRFTHRAWAKNLSARSFDELVLATGQTWEIDGPPLEWTNPRTGETYFELQLVGYELDPGSA